MGRVTDLRDCLLYTSPVEEAEMKPLTFPTDKEPVERAPAAVPAMASARMAPPTLPMVISVSYTHLDVYKRQVYCTA